jgi:hypothetical protein
VKVFFSKSVSGKRRGHAPPAWAVKHREPGDPDYYEQLVSETISDNIWPIILDQCSRGKVKHVFIRVENVLDHHGRLTISEPPRALPDGHPDIERERLLEPTVQEETEGYSPQPGGVGESPSRLDIVHSFDVGPAVIQVFEKLNLLASRSVP